jgi:hypothetical protein
MVAMTRTGSVPRIVLDAGIVGRGHAKIADRGHVPWLSLIVGWLSLIVGMFTCTLCIIKGIENRKGCKQFAAQKKLSCVLFIVSSSRCIVFRHC